MNFLILQISFKEDCERIDRKTLPWHSDIVSDTDISTIVILVFKRRISESQRLAQTCWWYRPSRKLSQFLKKISSFLKQISSFLKLEARSQKDSRISTKQYSQFSLRRLHVSKRSQSLKHLKLVLETDCHEPSSTCWLGWQSISLLTSVNIGRSKKYITFCTKMRFICD